MSETTNTTKETAMIPESEVHEGLYWTVRASEWGFSRNPAYVKLVPELVRVTGQTPFMETRVLFEGPDRIVPAEAYGRRTDRQFVYRLDQPANVYGVPDEVLETESRMRTAASAGKSNQ